MLQEYDVEEEEQIQVKNSARAHLKSYRMINALNKRDDARKVRNTKNCSFGIAEDGRMEYLEPGVYLKIPFCLAE